MATNKGRTQRASNQKAEGAGYIILSRNQGSRLRTRHVRRRETLRVKGIEAGKAEKHTTKRNGDRGGEIGYRPRRWKRLETQAKPYTMEMNAP